MDNEELKAENARLKAENEKYRRCFQGERDWVLMEPGEYARLKAEVDKWKSWAEAEHAEKKVVKAEVERLTKAGDAMKFDCLNYLRELEKRPFWFPLLSELEVNHKSVQEWNAAKEGKQSNG